MLEETITFASIFQMQRLILNKNDQKKLKTAQVAIAGIGGIGCYITEFLARNGIGHLRIADPDKFKPNNARQLFMTTESLYQRKAEVAAKRLTTVNPLIESQVYPGGITPENYLRFCRGANIIVAQTDLITSQLLLYIAAAKLKLPIIHAGRAEWPNRHLVTASVYDFRNSNGKFQLKELGINPSKWGVKKTDILKEFVEKVEKKENCAQLIQVIDSQNKQFRLRSFLNAIRNGNTSSISDKKRKYLLEVAADNPENFYEMAITPELCAVSAALVTTIVKNLILNRPVKRLAIDLYHGKAFTLE